MAAQPYPLWIVWDETEATARATYHARVIGWRELPGPDRPAEMWPSTGPYPVVIHPETMLPTTLGYDGPSSVSRMDIGDDLRTALHIVVTRRDAHGGQR